MKATLEAINQMQADGVICHYALGGTVAATYYIEPLTTSEVEVVVILPFNPAGPKASQTSLHEHLITHRCKADGEYFDVGGWPVRFEVASNDLEREAVASSLPVPVDNGRTWVMMAEHLVAIALTLNRLKDEHWMIRFIERDVIDELTLRGILTLHDLTGKWALFERGHPSQFPSEEEMRNQLAVLSFSEKLKILGRLRDREQTLAAAGLRRRSILSEAERVSNRGDKS